MDRRSVPKSDIRLAMRGVSGHGPDCNLLPSDEGASTFMGPSPKDFFNNFKDYDAPLAEKLRLAVRNTLIKRRQNAACCGNHGEPGC